MKILYVGIYLHKDSLCADASIQGFYMWRGLSQKDSYSNNEENIDSYGGSQYNKILHVRNPLRNDSLCGEAIG